MISNNKFLFLVSLVAAIVILNQSLFFSFMGLLGLNYEGSEESNIYAAYLIISFSIISLAYLHTVFKKGLLKGEIFIWAIILLYFSIHFLWVLFDPIKTKLLPLFMIHSFLLGFVGLISALTIVKLNLMEEVIKVTEPLLIIQAMGIS